MCFKESGNSRKTTKARRAGFRRYSLNAIGDGRSEVTFLVDEDGILSVKAKEFIVGGNLG